MKSYFNSLGIYMGYCKLTFSPNVPSLLPALTLSLRSFSDIGVLDSPSLASMLPSVFAASVIPPNTTSAPSKDGSSSGVVLLSELSPPAVDLYPSCVINIFLCATAAASPPAARTWAVSIIAFLVCLFKFSFCFLPLAPDMYWSYCILLKIFSVFDSALYL